MSRKHLNRYCRIGTAPTLDTTLPRLNDADSWLGRSQFLLDEELRGALDEVRIYSAAQIAADAAAGPNRTLCLHVD